MNVVCGKNAIQIILLNHIDHNDNLQVFYGRIILNHGKHGLLSIASLSNYHEELFTYPT